MLSCCRRSRSLRPLSLLRRCRSNHPFLPSHLAPHRCQFLASAAHKDWNSKPGLDRTHRRRYTNNPPSRPGRGSMGYCYCLHIERAPRPTPGTPVN